MYNFDLSQKAILFLDGHCSRNNAELISLFKSEKNIIQTELIPGDTVKLSGLCITSDDVRPFLRNKKSDKKGSK